MKCQDCGSTWDDQDDDWHADEIWFGSDTPPEVVYVPFGRCPECGWTYGLDDSGALMRPSL